MENSDCAVLVLSCDKYSDAWQPCFSFFFKYWSDCPFPVYLATNRKEFHHPKVIQVFSNTYATWSEELKIILNQLNHEFVLILLEDYFIYEKVNTQEIDEIIKLMKKTDAAYMRLAAFPSRYNSWWTYDLLPDHPNVGTIRKGNKYRVCLQTTIWKRDILLQLVNGNESPWEFEIEGSKRSDRISNPFLCIVEDKGKNYVHGPITYYCTAITKGKWMRGALRLSEKNGIEVDTSAREIETATEELIRKIYIRLPQRLKKLFDFINHRTKFITK